MAIARAEYREALGITSDIALVGACSESVVRTDAPDPEGRPTLFVSGEGGLIANLTVTGPRMGVVAIGSGTAARIEAVVVRNAAGAGVAVVEGASAQLSDVLIRDVTNRDPALLGSGLLVQNADAVAERIVVERSDETAVLVRQTERNAGRTTLEASDLVARGNRVTESGVATGLFVVSEASLELERGLVEHAVGLGANNIGQSSGTELASMSLTDVVIRDVTAAEGSSYSAALQFSQGSTTQLERVLLDANEGNGLVGVYGTGSGVIPSLTGSDLVIRDTASLGAPDGRGRGLNLGAPIPASISRLVVDGASDIGILVGDPSDIAGARADLSDVVVSRTQPSDRGNGYGILTQAAAALTLERALLEENATAALMTMPLGASSTVSLSDLLVRDTHSALDGHFGRGLQLSAGTLATVRRARFERNRDAGIAVFGLDGLTTRLVADQIEITGTRRARCGEIPEGDAGSCIYDGRNFSGGSALTLTAGLEASVQAFLFADSAYAGLRVASAWTTNAAVLVTGRPDVDARVGEIHDNEVGINIEPELFDAQRFDEDVFVHDNGVDFARDSLEPPSVSELIE